MKKIFSLILFFLLLIILSISSQNQTFASDYSFQDPLRNSVDHTGFEYAPSIIYWNGKYRMYYCSQASNSNPDGSWDSIRYAESTDGIHWQIKGEVLRSANNAYSVATCDPQVVVFNNRIYLYYSDCPGSANNYDNSCLDSSHQSNNLTRIGVARSTEVYTDEPSWDGPFEKYTQQDKWVRYNFDTNTPNTANSYPKMLIPPDCAVPTNRCPEFLGWRYGQGQQTIVFQNGKIHMWWYDDTSPGQTTKVPKLKYATSTDGVNFTEPITVDLPDSSQYFEGEDSYVVYNPYSKEFFLTTFLQRHASRAEVIYTISPDGRNWSNFQNLLTQAQTPDGSNNIGLSHDIWGNIIPEKFLLGFNNNRWVWNGRLVTGDLQVSPGEGGIVELNNDDKLLYTAPGWKKSENMNLDLTDGWISIGLKADKSFKANEMAGFYFTPPAGKRITKISFDWQTNYDNSKFYAALDGPNNHALWKNDRWGVGQGRAEVLVAEGSLVGFGLFSKANYNYPYGENQWYFKVKNIQVFYVETTNLYPKDKQILELPQDYPYAVTSELGGWANLNRFLSDTLYSLGIGLKKNLTYQKDEFVGFYLVPPSDRRITKISFNYWANFGNNEFNPVVQTDGGQILWRADNIGGGRAEVDLPPDRLIHLGLLTNRDYQYPYKDNEWRFELKDIKIHYQIKVSFPIGDLNNDYQVNSQDLKILLRNWGDSLSEPRADLNSDGTVNGIDFGKIKLLL